MQRVIVSPSQIIDTTLTLTADQQHYLKRVLRLQAGDRFLALDGQGHLWLAALATETTQATLTPVSEPTTAAAVAAKPHITLAACLPKQGFDDVVRQVTELGVDQIVPLLSDRTLPR
ncbi:MAG: RsmE family RNA methyltransferase, partial [Cyanobacteria bacterium P01_D01_bin.115]